MESVSIPAVAIGGINGSNIGEIRGSGVSGAAMVSAVFGAEDIAKAAALLKEQVKEVIEG